MTKYNKIRLIDATDFRSGNAGDAAIQGWKIFCNDRNNNGKISNFIKTTRSCSPSSQSGPTSLPPIGKCFMYIDTSCVNRGNNVFLSWERTAIIKITNITFLYNRYSILTNDSLKSMGRFRIQMLMDDNTWSRQFTTDKNTQYSVFSTDWTLLNLDFTV